MNEPESTSPSGDLEKFKSNRRRKMPLQHRIFFDCIDCKNLSKDTLRRLIFSLCERTKMKPLTDFQEAQAEDGYSIQMIWEASTLAIHSWDDESFVSIDIYSCKKIDVLDVLKCIKEELKPEWIEISSPVVICRIKGSE